MTTFSFFFKWTNPLNTLVTHQLRLINSVRNKHVKQRGNNLYSFKGNTKKCIIISTTAKWLIVLLHVNIASCGTDSYLCKHSWGVVLPASYICLPKLMCYEIWMVFKSAIWCIIFSDAGYLETHFTSTKQQYRELTLICTVDWSRGWFPAGSNLSTQCEI